MAQSPKSPFVAFGCAVLACFALIWGAEWAFPNSAASLIVLLTVIVIGLWIVRPGQVVYRWLEQRQVSGRAAVVATALAYAWGHLGPVFTGSPIGATFYLLLSAYMIWVGVLLGEIRRASGSWLMSWVGHFAHNVAVLYALSTLRAS